MKKNKKSRYKKTLTLQRNIFEAILALVIAASLNGCASMTEKDGLFAKDVTVTNYDRIYVDKEISVEVKLDSAQNNPGVLLLNKEVIYKNLVSELKEKGISATSDSPEQYFVIIDKYTSRGFEEQASTVIPPFITDVKNRGLSRVQ